MKNPFTALFRARDKHQDSVSAAPTFYFGTSGSGKPVNAYTAVQFPRFMPASGSSQSDVVITVTYEEAASQPSNERAGIVSAV